MTIAVDFDGTIAQQGESTQLQGSDYHTMAYVSNTWLVPVVSLLFNILK